MKRSRLSPYHLVLNTGFTLIELLIAAAIFSVIILSLYSAYHTGILSYRKADSAFELCQTARLTLNRMELDLKNSFSYGDAKGSKFIGKEDSLEFFSIIDSYEGGEPKADICRIKYELLLKDGIKSIFRAIYKGLDALKSDLREEGRELAASIEKIAFQYAGPKVAEGNPSFEWQGSWPDEAKAQEKILPIAVKITLTFTDGAEFTKIVPLPQSEQSGQ